jgi:heme exporter protein C
MAIRFLNSHKVRYLYSGLIILLLFGLVISFFEIVASPEDYLQSIYVKIIYIHVPSAWLALGIYSGVALSAILFLITKNTIFDLLATAVAPIGFIFSILTLITGSIWGKPTWGAWWVWDARLTSMLILAFIYIGYLSIKNNILNPEKAAYLSSVFAIVGFINIPIIKFSVYIWNTLHQGSTFFRMDGPSIHSSMLTPLIYSTLTIVVYTCLIALLRLNILLNLKKLNRMQIN